MAKSFTSAKSWFEKNPMRFTLITKAAILVAFVIFTLTCSRTAIIILLLLMVNYSIVLNFNLKINESNLLY